MLLHIERFDTEHPAHCTLQVSPSVRVHLHNPWKMHTFVVSEGAFFTYAENIRASFLSNDGSPLANCTR